MTDDDIIRMTIEASAIGSSDELDGDGIKRFSALVATFVAAAEREACARVFDLNDTVLFFGSQAAREIRKGVNHDLP